MAIKNLGSYELVEETLREFFLSLKEKIENIEANLKHEDWKNYTILVHALKSSARLVGAEKISSTAEYLENCGDAQAEEEIKNITPALLEDCKKLEEELSKIFNSENSDIQKETLDIKTFEEAMKNIEACAQAFDFSTADEIIKMLKKYEIPEEKKDLFEKVTLALSNVDRSEVLKILSEA